MLFLRHLATKHPSCMCTRVERLWVVVLTHSRFNQHISLSMTGSTYISAPSRLLSAVISLLGMTTNKPVFTPLAIFQDCPRELLTPLYHLDEHPMSLTDLAFDFLPMTRQSPSVARFSFNQVLSQSSDLVSGTTTLSLPTNSSFCRSVLTPNNDVSSIIDRCRIGTNFFQETILWYSEISPQTSWRLCCH